MANTLLMPKATAVWLVDNTGLSFEQIAQFCALHPLEVKAIADGESAQGIKGMDPIITGQLTREEIEGRNRSEPPAEALRAEGARAEIEAQGSALHPSVQAAGSPQRHPLAGAQPSRIEGCGDLAPCRNDQVDDRADSRSQALERRQPRADGSGYPRPLLADRPRHRSSACFRAARSRPRRSATRCCRHPYRAHGGG